MTLEDLRRLLEQAGPVGAVAGWPADAASRPLAGVAYDSRQVVPGSVFFALHGQQADGAAFAPQAIARGAVAVVAESVPPAGTAATWFAVADARRALAIASDAWYHHPSHDMQVVGITGTNGKTTTAYLLSAIFEAAGIPCGILGTVVYRIGTEEREATRTTPEAPDVQRLLCEMVDRGSGACAMEVSSHALALHRVDGMHFAAAVFTNLTRDHLDFHRDMESYFAAKRRLFEMLDAGAPAVVNLDDPRGATLAALVQRPVTYGIRQPADIAPGPLSVGLDGLRFDVRTPQGRLRIESPLVGRPNAYNILAAVGAASALGLPLDAIERGVRTLARVPGRFQVVSNPSDELTVVVDYAHTDDALRNLLETARPLARGRLITVFGCGGNRDRTKRPLMGAVAARLSDVVIVTSDNPRGEDPARIIQEVRRGLTPDTTRDTGASALQHLEIVDRKAAIGKAIELARPGDLVLIAGKGHEHYQIIGDRVLPFDDVAVARDALARRRTNSGVR
ncbi:MAG TPA: UDP-N-acetylmuramoyl-L-alanyl-D-glutamate--2,6-diaminopimelate ligase [Vicinamibacterales bacterium]|nr:UDP-N-acetylmuramoyl-L-alanyl-D-glutamate--2,6-diaminopimelate ligase [Vicinamibacterales bacterium]